MKRNPLGRTGIEVSDLCLGSMNWGTYNNQADADAQIGMALDAGVNFIDTAEAYPVPQSAETQGTTERMIGDWLARSGRRADIVLATKIAGRGVKWVRDGIGIDGKGLRSALEGSLARLQTDYIDLYQLHWPNRGSYHFERSWDYDPRGQDSAAVRANLVDVLETLDALVREGKIRHFGLSNETAWGTLQFIRLAEDMDLPRPVSIQNEYSLLRRHFDLDMAEIAHHEQIGLLAWSPLAGGILSGKYLDGALPPGSRGTVIKDFWRLTDDTGKAVRAYVNLARDHGLDPAQMALAFCRTRPFMTSTIIGATSLDQLRTNLGAATLDLDADILHEIDTLFRRFPRPF